ncbi:MAG: Ig-like domain-containing protein [Rikenellaceae bacterium]
MKKNFRAIFASMLCITMLAACSKDEDEAPNGDDGVEDSVSTITSISLTDQYGYPLVSGDVMPMIVCENYKINVEILPESAASESMSFVVDDSSVVEVLSDNSLEGLSVGTTTLTIMPTLENDEEAAEISITLNVIPFADTVTGFDLTDVPYAVYDNASLDLTSLVAVLPSTATFKNVVYESLTPDIAEVSVTGEFTALQVGTAIIRMTATDDTAYSEDINILIENSTIAETITIEPVSFTNPYDYTDVFSINETYQIQYSTVPESVASSSIEWTSSNTEVATVTAGGIVTFKNMGSTSTNDVTITATCVETGDTDDITLTVAPGFMRYSYNNIMFVPLASVSNQYAGVSYVFDNINGKMSVTFGTLTSASPYRATFQAATGSIVNANEYPIIAMKAQYMSNKYDETILYGSGTPSFSSSYGSQNVTLVSGLDLGDNVEIFYTDLSNTSSFTSTDGSAGTTYSDTFDRTQATQVRVLEYKITGIYSSASVPVMDVYWVRSFASLEDLEKFASEEAAVGESTNETVEGGSNQGFDSTNGSW